MNRVGRAALVLSLGIVISRMVWSGGFGWFVQQRMRIPLVLAAAVLLGFGIFEAFAGAREEQRDPDSHYRSAGPRVGWLLIAPVVVLLSVAPTGLGAAAADRVEAYTPTASTERYPPLPASDAPLEMRVFDYLDRAIWAGDTLDGRTIRLEGLVVNDPELPQGFKLTRFMVSCCAADGIPLQVTVHHDGAMLPNDTWVVADVVWRRPAVPYADAERIVVEADAVSITVDPDPPDDPYESPY